MTERRAKILKVLGGAGLTTNVRQLKRTLDALRVCEPEDLDEILGASRQQLLRSVGEDVEELLWTMTLPLDGGEDMLQRICRDSTAMRGLLRGIWQRDPITPVAPLNLVIYSDEIVPGNVLRLDHSRKLFLLFWSIKELAPTILKSTDARVPMLDIRATTLKKVIGGISKCVRLFFAAHVPR